MVEHILDVSRRIVSRYGHLTGLDNAGQLEFTVELVEIWEDIEYRHAPFLSRVVATVVSESEFRQGLWGFEALSTHTARHLNNVCELIDDDQSVRLSPPDISASFNIIPIVDYYSGLLDLNPALEERLVETFISILLHITVCYRPILNGIVECSLSDSGFTRGLAAIREFSRDTASLFNTAKDILSRN